MERPHFFHELPHEIFRKESEEIQRIACESHYFHTTFDDRWRDHGHLASFHNWQHILAEYRATQATFQILREKKLDLLGICADLELYNQMYGTGFNLDDAEKAYKIKSLRHDYGNIMAGLRPVNARLEPQYQDIYRARDAEARSREMAMQLNVFHEEGSQEFGELVGDLIYQTRYNFSDSSEEGYPGARIVRVFDQIGGNRFSENPYRVAGLIDEQVTEGTVVRINPHRQFECFVDNRFCQLWPDDQGRARIFEEWQPYITNCMGKLMEAEYPDRDKDAVEYLNDLYRVIRTRRNGA